MSNSKCLSEFGIWKLGFGIYFGFGIWMLGFPAEGGHGGVRVLTGKWRQGLRAKDDTVLVKTCQNTNANQEFALAA